MASRPRYTLLEVAERLRCSRSTAESLIRLGLLEAIDTSTNPTGRRRYIVTAEALEEFEAKRTTKPPEPEPVRRRRRVAVPAGGVIEFFK